MKPLSLVVFNYFTRLFKDEGSTAPEYAISDDELRREILDREKRIQIKINLAHRNISRFVTNALSHSMQTAQTTDPHKLYTAALTTYQELSPPFVLVHDFVLVEVIRYCIKHQCIPSPLPEEWAEYVEQLTQIKQNISATTNIHNVQAEVQITEQDKSANVRSSNVVPIGQTLPLLAAMGELKRDLGDKAQPAYALYAVWCSSLTNDLLTVRGGRDWAKQHASGLTQKQTDTLLKAFKLKALNSGLLVPNPTYTGKPPHPEYIISQLEHATRVNHKQP